MYRDRPGATKGAKMTSREADEALFAELDARLAERVKQDADLDELFQEVRADVRERFAEGCMFCRIVQMESAEPDYALEFRRAMHAAIQQRSQALAAVKVRERRLAGEEISAELNVVAIMLRDRDNNTPDYQRRVALYELAKQVADRVA